MKNDLTMLVVAAGQGRRFGGPLPKQYLPLQGRPLLWHTLSRLHEHPDIRRIVPVIAPDGDELWRQWMAGPVRELPKVAPPVTGDRERQLSVYNGLRALELDGSDWVGIHDGARPLVDRALLTRLFAQRGAGDAWIAAIPASDTVKRVDGSGFITETVPREQIWLAQTPQLFRYGLALRAHREAALSGFLGTDDASLVERLGVPVGVVPGHTHNIKVTRADDLGLAAFFLQEGERP